MSKTKRPGFLLKVFVVGLAVGGGTSPTSGCVCDQDPPGPLCDMCSDAVSRCEVGGSKTAWDCTSELTAWCSSKDGVLVDFDCSVYRAGTGGTTTGSGPSTTAGDGADSTGAEPDWTPSEHIEAGSEAGHFNVTEAFADYAAENPELLLVRDGTIALLLADGCADIDTAGALPTAMGLVDGDAPLRVNRLSLHEDDAVATAAALASETDFTLEVRSSAPRAWFVRPKLLHYHIE